MFPLAGKTFPKTLEELTTAIHGALADVFDLPQADKTVKATGGDYPTIKKLSIDLDGATVRAKEPPPKPKPAGKREPGVTVGQLEVSGHPIRYENSKLEIDLKAKGVKLDFAKDKNGHPLLVLTDAEDGQAEAKISKSDIQSLVMAIATAAAKQHGVTVQDIQLNLTSEGKRSVAADVRVQAKKAIVSGVVHLTGRADLDDDLNAKLSNLSCTGEGMIGKMAAGFLQGKLKEYDGKTFPLMAFSLGDVTLKDLKVDTKSGLHVTAKFGSK
jgi:hypothetical protein